MQTSNERFATPLAAARNLAEIADAAGVITKLQVKLLRSELTRFRRQLLVPAVVAVTSLAAAFSSILLLLLGLAMLAAELTRVPLAWSLMIVAGISGLLSSVIACVAWLWIRSLKSPLRHLRSQFLEDAMWLKSRLGR